MVKKFATAVLSAAFLAALFAQAARAAESASGTTVETAAEAAPDAGGILADLGKRLQAMEKKSGDSEKIRFEGYVDLRYDAQKYNIGKYYNPQDPATPRLLDQKEVDTMALYGRRTEFKVTGALMPNLGFAFSYDFFANYVRDAGVEISGVTMFPSTGIPDWTYSVKVGQFRQKFGIEPQVGSARIDFAERAMIYGGANPFGTFTYGNISYTTQGTKTIWVPVIDAAGNTLSYFQATTPTAVWNTASVLNVAPKIVGERLMGVHLLHKKNMGFLAYDVGASLVNNNTEDQTPGQVKPSAAFPRSVQDLNPSVTSRLGLEPVFLNNLLPFNILLKVGASYANDSQNTDPASADNNKISREEIAGVDAVLEMFKALRLQAEWLGANQFGQLPFAGPNSGVYFTDKNADAVKAGQISITGDGVFGLVNRREGWYATAVLKPLNFFMADAPTLELAGRYESFIPNVHNAWMASGITPISTATFMVKCNVYNPYSVNAATLGLKWTYAGNCHTMINYTVYGPDGNFGAAGGTELALVQQQFAF